MAEPKTVQAKTTGNAESRVAVLDERPVFEDQGVQVVPGRVGTAVISTSGRPAVISHVNEQPAAPQPMAISA